jgi:hypothetical protein
MIIRVLLRSPGVRINRRLNSKYHFSKAKSIGTTVYAAENNHTYRRDTPKGNVGILLY